MAEVAFTEATGEMRGWVAEVWGEVDARHLHIEDGFAILVLCGERPFGLISVYPCEPPPPLAGERVAFIDFLDVVTEFRRRGIGRRLVEMAAERARGQGLCQIRACSSADKVEAIPMWKRLGFALCPARDRSGRTREFLPHCRCRPDPGGGQRLRPGIDAGDVGIFGIVTAVSGSALLERLPAPHGDGIAPGSPMNFRVPQGASTLGHRP